MSCQVAAAITSGLTPQQATNVNAQTQTDNNFELSIRT